MFATSSIIFSIIFSRKLSGFVLCFLLYFETSVSRPIPVSITCPHPDGPCLWLFKSSSRYSFSAVDSDEVSSGVLCCCCVLMVQVSWCLFSSSAVSLLSVCSLFLVFYVRLFRVSGCSLFFFCVSLVVFFLVCFFKILSIFCYCARVPFSAWGLTKRESKRWCATWKVAHMRWIVSRKQSECLPLCFMCDNIGLFKRQVLSSVSWHFSLAFINIAVRVCRCVPLVRMKISRNNCILQRRKLERRSILFSLLMWSYSPQPV